MPEEEKKNKIIFKYLRYKESTGSNPVPSEVQWKPVALKKYLVEETGNIEERFKSTEEFTGCIEDKSHMIIEYPFERYVVSIELTPNNEFVGITEIALSKDFRSLQEKIRTDKIFDIEKLDFEG